MNDDSDDMVGKPRWREDEPTRTWRTSLGLSIAAITIGVAVMIGALVWVNVAMWGIQLAPGPLAADHDTHLIGNVPPDTPIPPVRFLLQIRGAPVVTELDTNLECVTARLVQAGQDPSWSGMSGGPGEPFAPVQMLPFQPAYLEVRIDPQAHSADDSAVAGRTVDHKVSVKTADGEMLSFDITTGSGQSEAAQDGLR